MVFQWFHEDISYIIVRKSKVETRAFASLLNLQDGKTEMWHQPLLNAHKKVLLMF